MSLRSKLVRARPAPPPPAPAGPSPEQVIVDALVSDVLTRPEPGWYASKPVSEALYERLQPEDLAQLDAALEGSAKELWDVTHEAERRRLALVLIAHYELQPALDRIGLTSVVPPQEVHAMARGPLAAGGDPPIADLVIGCLHDAGFDLAQGATLLDFGCSSGRVLRPIAAWRPDLDCVGCDPQPGAIEWAGEHLPMARFFVSPGVPPLPLEGASVDAAFAISIWSHFAEPQALTWLQEMHRIVRPGGAMLLTSHGIDSLATFVRREQMNHESAAEVVRALVRHGHHWFDVFGADGDWGVKDTGWGNGYLSMDWLLRHATPGWAVRLFLPAGIDQNQDVVVLERRP